MEHTFFNSFDPAFRSPVGAVPVETPITFTLATPADYGDLLPRLVIHRDGCGQELVEMNFSHSENGCHYYSVTYTPWEVGL